MDVARCDSGTDRWNCSRATEHVLRSDRDTAFTIWTILCIRRSHDLLRKSDVLRGHCNGLFTSPLLVLRDIKGCFDRSRRCHVPDCISDNQNCQRKPSWCIRGPHYRDDTIVPVRIYRPRSRTSAYWLASRVYSCPRSHWIHDRLRYQHRCGATSRPTWDNRL